LAYTNDTTVILCTQSFTSVSLTNGVFHLKLNLDCSPDTLEEVLLGIPTNESVAIRITDETHAKVYSFQALYSMPLATMAKTAKNLMQMNAIDGQVLTWDSGAWKPLAPASLAPGSVGTTELADGSVTDPKVATGISRGKLAGGNPGYVLVNDGSGLISETPQLSILQGGTGASTAAGAWTNLGIVIGTTAGQFMGADAVPSCAANEKLFMTLGPTYLWDCIPDGDATKLPLAGGQMSGAIDMFTNRIIDVGSPIDPGDAANKAYVDSEISAINASQWTTNGSNIHFDMGNVGLGTSTPTQKLDVVGNIALSGKVMLQSDTANYVELKAPLSLASTLTFNLPGTYGTSGYALITDGAGNLSWSSVATTSTSLGGDLSGSISNAQIIAGAIVDVDISGTAAIAQSKIANLTSDLAAKESAIAAGTIAQYWRGDKTWQTLNTTIVPEGANLYFTEPKVLGTDLAGLSTTTGTVTATDTVLSSIGKIVGNFDAISASQANYVLKAGDTMSGALAMGANQITGLADPSLASDAATKNYVDTQVATKTSSQWTTAGSNIHFNTGNVGLGTSTPAQKLDVIGNIALTGKLQLKSDTANYVELKAPLSLASTLTFNLPSNYGTSGQALTTNGLGTMSWTDVATTATAVGGDLTGSISNAQIASGVVGSAEIADGSIVNADVATTAAIAQSKIANLTTDLAAKEPIIAAGTTAQYWRGDKTWQVLNTSVVPEGTNLYFLDSRVRAAIMSGYAVGSAVPVAATDTLLEALGKLEGQIIANDAAFDATGQWSKNGSDIYFNTGNVGIGTTTPSAALQIVKSDSDPQVKIKNESSTIERYPGLKVINYMGTGNGFPIIFMSNIGGSSGGPTATGAERILGSIIGAGYDGAGGWPQGARVDFVTESAFTGTSNPTYIKFATTSTNQTSTTEKMRVTADGKVGIGTPSPGSKLHVEGSGELLRLTSSGFGTLYMGSDINHPWIGTSTNHKLRLVTNGISRVYIDETGNVGAGTATPIEKLHVAGNIYANMGEGFRIKGDPHYFGTNLDGIVFEQLDQNNTNGNTDGGLVFRGLSTSDSIAKEWMVIKSPGNIGLGTSSPRQRLDIAGDGKMIFGPNSSWGANLIVGGNGWVGPDATVAATNGNLHLESRTGAYATYINWYGATAGLRVGNGTSGGYGPVYASAFTVSSDERLKENIENVSDALSKISKIRGVTYNYIDNRFNQDRQIGVIAQEVQRVFPEAVLTDEEGVLSVNYSVLVAPLIEAVKEQEEQIKKNVMMLNVMKGQFEEQEKQLSNNKRRIASLEKHNVKLEDRLQEMEQENLKLKQRLEKIERLLSKSFK
jgi:hypothetical protein